MRRLTPILFALLALPLPAGADMGGVPFGARVRVFEPNQRAMIAWNGKEEILLLSTELHASEAGKVLEVLPLPSQPEIKKGSLETFKRATDLVNASVRRTGGGTNSGYGGYGGAGGASTPPAAVLTFHEQIGAHDISTLMALRSEEFVAWVEEYLKKAGVDNPTIPEVLKESIARYLKEGCRWFVFDVVSLTKEQQTHEPIQYRFATPRLYYPLKISRTDEGDTTIDLLILSPGLFRTFRGYWKERIKIPTPAFRITADQLRSIDPDMDALLDHQENMWLRIWRIRGKLADFRQDLLAE